MKSPGRSQGREEDMMSALKLLLDKLNSGNIPLSPEMWKQMQTGKAASGSTVTNINISGGAANSVSS